MAPPRRGPRRARVTPELHPPRSFAVRVPLRGRGYARGANEGVLPLREGPPNPGLGSTDRRRLGFAAATGSTWGKARFVVPSPPPLSRPPPFLCIMLSTTYFVDIYG